MRPTAPPRIGMMVTCPVDLCHPAAGFVAVAQAGATGCALAIPAQGCCGRLALMDGDRQAATLQARAMIAAFDGCDGVAVAHRECAAMVRDHYPALLAPEPHWAGRARDMAARCHDLADLLSGIHESGNTPHWQVAKAAQDAALPQLASHLEQITQQVTDNGGKVHWAVDAADALAIIRQLCLTHGVGPVIHDGSPITVEIGLEAALVEAGLTASHLTRTPLIGVTGARILVAETGSAVLILDGADVRSALARCHIVLAGIDQVLPRLDDAAPWLRLTQTDGTMPSRVIFANGPRQPEDADGAEAFHLILLDNGRTELLAASVSPPPSMEQRWGRLWHWLARRPALYRRITHLSQLLSGRGGTFQGRWRAGGHG